MTNSGTQPCFNVEAPVIIPGGLGRQFQVSQMVSRTNDNPSTPPGSTTTYSRLNRVKPDVYEVTDTHKQRGGDTFMLKAVCYEGGIMTLVNEAKILSRMSWVWPRIAPRLITQVHTFKDVYYFVYEKFSSNDWESLDKIIRSHGPITNPDEMMQLQSAIYASVHWLHFHNVIHGDLKDEHILIRKIKRGTGCYTYDFGDIRFIDFGFGSLNRVGRWNGASIGFASAYFWNRSHRTLLSHKELLAQDWYGAYASLYYAFTGECFPTTSPTYSALGSPNTNDNVSEYYNELVESLNTHHRSETQRHAILSALIRRLAQPDSLGDPSWAETVFTYLGREIVQHRLLMVIGFMAAGMCGVFFSGWAGTVLALLVLVLFIYSRKSWKLLAETHDEIKTRPKIKSQGYLAGALLVVVAVIISVVSAFNNGFGIVLGIISLMGLVGLLTVYLLGGYPDALILCLLTFVSPVLPPFLYPLIPLLCGWFVRFSGASLGVIVLGLVLNAFLTQLLCLGRMSPVFATWSVSINSIWQVGAILTGVIWLLIFLAASRSRQVKNIRGREKWVIAAGLGAAGLPYLAALLLKLPVNINLISIVQTLFVLLIAWVLGLAVVMEPEETMN